MRSGTGVCSVPLERRRGSSQDVQRLTFSHLPARVAAPLTHTQHLAQYDAALKLPPIWENFTLSESISTQWRLYSLLSCLRGTVIQAGDLNFCRNNILFETKRVNSTSVEEQTKQQTTLRFGQMLLALRAHSISYSC